MDAILTFIFGFLSAFALMLVVSFIISKSNVDFDDEQWPIDQGQEETAK